MNAKAAATLSAAGAVLVAGCSGGSVAGGNFHPPPSTVAQTGQRLSLTFKIPRSAPVIANTSARRRAASGSRSISFLRRPQFLSPSISNGYLVVRVYQNGQQAGADQKFTVGLSGTDFVCYFAPPLYQYELCYNVASVYAPGGSDTFYALAYDASNNLIAVTPGLAGYYGSAPAPYTVPYSGSITIPTYAYASRLQVLSPTPCISPTLTPLQVTDSDGFILDGPLANPVTVTTGGGFNLAYLGSSVGTTYTFYDADLLAGFFTLAAASPGASSPVAVTSPTGALSTNFSTVYAVDHTALVVSTSGLYAFGLYAGASAPFNCGRANIYNGLSIFAFTNPVAMTADSAGNVAILDNTGTNPTVEFIPANDLFVAPIVGAIVDPVTLPSTGPLDVTISNATTKIYALNSDGTVQVVDFSAAIAPPFTGPVNAFATGQGITAPSGSGIAVVYGSGGDDVFVSSYTTNNVFEIDNANASPAPLLTQALNGVSAPPTSIPTTAISTGVAGDMTSGKVMFRVFDGAAPQNFVVECSIAALPCTPSLSGVTIGTAFSGAGSVAPFGTNSMLVLDANNVDSVDETSLVFSTVLSGLPSPARVVTSPDGAWFALQEGGTFNFFASGGASPIGSFAGTAAVILTGTFDF